MPRQQGKPSRAMTEEERLDDALELIIQGNHPYIADVAGASYNYALTQVSDMLKTSLKQPSINVDTILQKIEEMRFQNFISTRN